MSKKGAMEAFQLKISRNDRFAQMTHQEKLIEQKKKEIQAKLQQKQKTSNDKGSGGSKPSTKSATKVPEKKAQCFNTFSNDGSFLNQFKQMKEKKLEPKSKSFKGRDNHDDRNKNKWKRDVSIKETKVRVSRFSDKPASFEPKININTSYSNLLLQQNFDNQSGLVTAQNVTGQPLLKNLVTPQNVNYPLSPQNNPSVIAAPPLLLNVPPPQLQLQNSLILPSVSMEMPLDLCPTSVITTVTIPTQTTILQTGHSEGYLPQSCISTLSTIELANIPAPNPIQVHNIPQPEPINTLTIPPPAPIQVQNIPPPSPIQLIEIPNPKPLDILSIPTPNETDNNLTDPDFIKNVPPPNKSIPPPNLPETNLNLPPPTSNANQTTVPTCLPPPNIMPPTSIPPPPQNLLIPPPQTVTLVPPPQSNLIVQTIPPPNQGIIQNLPSQTLSISLPMTLQLPQNSIPPLMAQSIMPPPNMGIVPPPVNLNCSSLMMQNPPPSIQVPPPGFLSQQNQMVAMNLPPPSTTMRDLNEVFPPGSADYEAMASLGRMVAQCGPGIEDVVRKRNKQDPSLWFLFHKESAAYQQYLQLVDQFKAEIAFENNTKEHRPEDIYTPEVPNEDDIGMESMEEKQECDKKSSRKRKSRWGNKDESVEATGNVALSKVTRNDQALLQYAMNQFGSTNLSEEDWKKAEDHYKINVLYQDMLKKRQELERLQQRGQNKYEYDSDEDIDGGTWEHKLREKEMIATQLWSTELNRQAEGKHHIGDFLPPEEFKKFMEKSQAAKEGRQVDVSDYEEFKLKEDNVGFKLLQKLGWSEGTGLGSDRSGILEPVNKGLIRDTNQGLGLERPDGADVNDDEYDAYRKRMMLAYRFRPNPLNNPRRPYY